MNNTMTIGTQNNKGQIIGKVVDDNLNSFEVEGENFVEGKLLIDRVSENSDILPFTISEKLLKAGNLTLEKGSVILTEYAGRAEKNCGKKYAKCR